MEIIDSSLGMMYGTLLNPLLIGTGFQAGLVIPFEKEEKNEIYRTWW